MRIIIFGTGLFYQNRKNFFQKQQIICLADNDPAKQGKTIDGIKVIAPIKIKYMDYDYICIMTRPDYAAQIRKQLEISGIKLEKVIDFYQAKNLIGVTSVVDQDFEKMKHFNFSREPGKRLKKELNLSSAELALMTIVTPYYNAGKYFWQTFHSVMNQTFPWFEWLIVDDGSTNPNDIECLHRFAKMDQRIRIIGIENGGVSNARNIGFLNAKTEIIVPLDADDLISPQYLEYMYFGLYYNKDASWCYSGGVGFFEMHYLWHKPWDAEGMKTYNSLMVTAAIRKKDWEEVGGYKTEKYSYNEDWRFWLELLAKHKKPVILGGYHFWYRRMESGRLANLKKDSKRVSFDTEIIRKAAQQADGSVKAVEYPLANSNELYGRHQDIEWESRRIIAKKKGILRFLMIIPWMVMGGADRFNLNLVSGLNKEKYEITIMTTVPSSNDWQDRFEEITDEIFHLPEFLETIHYLEFVKYYIKTRQIDILFLSNSFLGYYMLPALRKSFPDLCIIDYVHMEEWYWKAGGHARTSGMMESVINKTYVCNSVTRNVLINYFKRDAKKVKTLYIGVDEEYFNSSRVSSGYLYEKLGIPKESPIILFPCRIHPQKRPFMVLEIAEKMKARHPEVVFAIVGDGPQLLDIMTETSQKQLEQNVKCIGRCDDIASCYKDAYITLICSIKEGLALTAYESCSMGVPVISSAVGGQGDLIDDSVGKLIAVRQSEDTLDYRFFDEKEIDEYVEAICELLEQKERYRQCCIHCRRKIIEYFSEKKMIENMEYELEHLMNVELKTENAEKARILQNTGWLTEEMYMLAAALEERER